MKGEDIQSTTPDSYDGNEINRIYIGDEYSVYQQVTERQKDAWTAAKQQAKPQTTWAELKVLKGYFTVIDGKLDFTCTTQGVSFEYVRDGLTKLRDEIQRQLDNAKECPYHKP